MKSKPFYFAIILVLSFSTNVWSNSIQAGADRVVELQHTDGKWGWPLNAPPTYANISGPIGLGLISAYSQTGDSAHLDAAKRAGDALVGLTSNWVGTYNPLFLTELSAATGDLKYFNQAHDFFSDLQAGTYERQGVFHDTGSFISTVQAGRAGTWNNLLPWEFAPLAVAASQAGTEAQVNAFAQAMQDGINSLSNSGDENADLLGLAGGVMGLEVLGLEFDPTAGAFASAGSSSDLAHILADSQNANGSWNFRSNVANDDDTQTAAYALLALSIVNDAGQYDDEIALGRQSLLSLQNDSGGWAEYPGGDENIEVDGEALWALSATQPVPETATLLLLGTGLTGLIAAKTRIKKASS